MMPVGFWLSKNMNHTEQKIGSEARKIIRAAVKKIIDVVEPTFGPAGKSVLLPRTYNRGQRIVDDGYYAAENVQLKDPHEKLVAEFFKEAITKTNTIAGDGTTGTALLGGALLENVFRQIPVYDGPAVFMPGDEKIKTVREIRKEIDDAVKVVVEKIKESAQKIDSLEQLKKVARISIGKEDEIVADKVAEIVWELARDSEGNYVDAHIDITDGFKGDVEFEKSVGMKFPAKISARAFVNRPERHEMVADDVPVMITNYKMDSIFVVSGILERCKVSKIAFFAPEFSTNVLMYMVQVSQKGLHCFPIKCPALRTEQLEDLAIYTNATLFDKNTGRKLENMLASDLGFAEKIVVKDTENREDATLLGGKGARIKRGGGNMIDQQITILKGQLQESRNDIEKISLQKRIANLNSAVGVIRVGSVTSGNQLFIKMKIEDGVYACKAALEEGIVKGGGLCLKEIGENLPKNILSDILSVPYDTIQKNAGSLFVIEDNVFDPVKVIRLSIEHAVSVVSTLITTNVIIAEITEKTPGDGYADIARAISKYVYYDAKHKGMLKDSEDEAKREREAEFERIMMTDHG